MTFIPEKKDALYVRGVVIACGMADDQGDIAPDKEGIKKIFTNYLEHQTDVQHSYIKTFNIHQLENTLTTSETIIAGQTVPAGSWIASHMVLNPSIMAMIRDKKLNGYSLGALGDAALNENISFQENFLNKSQLLYKDLMDYEELNPFFISFVKKASNGFVWEVMDYNQFLSKSSNTDGISVDGDIMTDKVKNEDDEMVKVSVVERLLQPFLNKASNDEPEPEDEEEENQKEDKKEDEKKKEEEKEVETVTNSDVMAKLEELPNLVAKGVVTAMMEFANKDAEAGVLAKGSEQEEEKQKEDENKEDKNEDEGKQDAAKMEKSSKEEGESKTAPLNKSSSKHDEMTQQNKVKPKQTFLGGERRDEYGRVRKYI